LDFDPFRDGLVHDRSRGEPAYWPFDIAPTLAKD
jgi:hypothetical protein